MATYGRQTYNYAYRLTGNEPDARDLTQEAFIRVFRAWRSFQPGTSFLSWIYRIVTNLHRDELRKRKGVFLQELPDDNMPHELPKEAVGHDPIAAIHDAQLSHNVEQALRALTPDQRAVVLLADVEERSYQEIAGIMACSIGTVARGCIGPASSSASCFQGFGKVSSGRGHPSDVLHNETATV